MSGFIDLSVLCGCSGGEHVLQAAPTPVPGLVVHALSHRDGEWAVTHAPSGCLVGPPCPDPESALHVAISLGRCGDWTRPGSDISVDAGMQLLRKAVLADLGLLDAALGHPQTSLRVLRQREAAA
jgi:hypothetical protein